MPLAAECLALVTYDWHAVRGVRKNARTPISPVTRTTSPWPPLIKLQGCDSRTMILRRKKAKTAIPKVLCHDSAKTLLEANGWVDTCGGKHSTKMEKEGQRPITLPRHHGRDYSADLRQRILQQAGLTRRG